MRRFRRILMFTRNSFFGSLRKFGHFFQTLQKHGSFEYFQNFSSPTAGKFACSRSSVRKFFPSGKLHSRTSFFRDSTDAAKFPVGGIATAAMLLSCPLREISRSDFSLSLGAADSIGKIKNKVIAVSTFWMH